MLLLKHTEADNSVILTGIDGYCCMLVATHMSHAQLFKRPQRCVGQQFVFSGFTCFSPCVILTGANPTQWFRVRVRSKHALSLCHIFVRQNPPVWCLQRHGSLSRQYNSYGQTYFQPGSVEAGGLQWVLRQKAWVWLYIELVYYYVSNTAWDMDSAFLNYSLRVFIIMW